MSFERPDAESPSQNAGPDAPRSNIDVACGELAFVDVTFVGLERLPGPGEERRAVDLQRSPGGGAITAIALARLGLRSALVSPIGSDPDGDFLRRELAAEGVEWAGRRVARTATTAVMPIDGDRAMATYDPGEQLTAAELAAVDPRAVVISLPRLALVPPDVALYATAGDAEARADTEAEADLGAVRALIVNEREACVMTGATDGESAARQLAGRAACAIVTLGERGAVAVCDGEPVQVPGIPSEVVDTTGAGDLFTAAYVWADHLGLALEDRLRWAVLYATLSVRVPTALAGAASRTALMEAGAERGLALSQSSVPMKEDIR